MVKAELSRKQLEGVRGFIGELYGHELHAKRVDALAGATLGVMAGACGQAGGPADEQPGH